MTTRPSPAHRIYQRMAFQGRHRAIRVDDLGVAVDLDRAALGISVGTIAATTAGIAIATVIPKGFEAAIRIYELRGTFEGWDPQPPPRVTSREMR
jgi:hypothetical protein